MSAFVCAMKTKGILILSGFYEEDVSLLEEKALSLGLRKSQCKVNHKWVCLTFLSILGLGISNCIRL